MENKDKKSRTEELDSFWDLSSLVPAQRSVASHTKSTHTVSVEVPEAPLTSTKPSPAKSTIVKRYIDPLHDENKKIRNEAFESRIDYELENSLIHSVTLKKRKSAYELYVDFLNTAIKLQARKGVETDYVSFYSYVPQYDQLSSQQLEYYLWWRECFKNGETVKTDLSYVLLYIYELINIGDAADVRYSQRMLAELWNCYHKEFPVLSSKLAVWICDFSLIHRLDPPENLMRSVTKYVSSLKEFFIRIPNDDISVCASSLLKYGTEYDYRASKFATEKNIDLFEKHIKGAMITAVKFFSKDGKVLSSLAAEDSKLIRNSFEGALCVSKWRYEIEVKYCSFSRSNELRFIMGDIVKYSENKLRAFLGIKSKLSVYSIGTDLQQALDTYFDNALATEPSRVVKKEEKHEYDRLYEVPVRKFSLENARRIEQSSWETTNELVTAFEEEQEAALSTENVISADVMTSQRDDVDSDLKKALGRYLEFVLAVKQNDAAAVSDFCHREGVLPDAIADAVNEIAVDAIGDVLVEDSGDGFSLIECYTDLI